MNLLIKQARVIDPLSPFHNKITDIFIENGSISKMGDNLSIKADQEINIKGLNVSPGWVDSFSNFADPGYEFKETLETGAASAAAGGYTDVFVIPNTKPPVHNKASVEYIVQKSRTLPVTIHPLGAISNNLEGKELAEMYDMHASGAIAFSDGLNCVQSSGLMVKALQYVRAFDGIIIQLPDDKSINPHGLMNEGIVSTQMGIQGKPSMAEELIVARDIKLARYAESKLHITGASTKKSVEYIKRGKDSGTSVTCSVTPYHLFFTDEDLKNYDTNLKVNPPLRTKEEKEFLKKAVLDGSIDCLASHHLPHEYDSKVMEFEYAKTGMIGMETAFAVLRTAIPSLSIERIIELLAINPRKIFGMDACTIKEGNSCSMTLFDPELKWIVNAKDIKSRSKNSSFIDIELTGKPIGIINKGMVLI